MKLKEKQQLRGMKPHELRKRVSELRANISNLKIERTTKPVKNVRSVYNLRKALAVTQSILGEKEKEQKLADRKGAASV